MVDTDAASEIPQEPLLPGRFSQHAADDISPLAGTPYLRTGLTIDDVAHPAYMVNYNLELTWCNESARRRILEVDALPAQAESRSIFRLLPPAPNGGSGKRRSELMRLYIALAKSRLSKVALLGIVEKLDDADATAMIEGLYNEGDHLTRKVVVDMPCLLDDGAGRLEAWRVYGVYFREGILIVHVPAAEVDPDLLEFISRRDIVVSDLMRKQLPVFTPLVVLAADLQDAARIRAELPPDEYGRLRSEIWAAMQRIIRRYCGTNSRHVGDRILCYFLPQPDSNYVLNAVACAHEFKREMRSISRRWRLDKNWPNELRLEPALHERQEWFERFPSGYTVEFAVAGNLSHPAAQPVDLGRFEAVCTTCDAVEQSAATEPARVDAELRDAVTPNASVPPSGPVQRRGRSLAAMWRAAEYRAPAHA